MPNRFFSAIGFVCHVVIVLLLFIPLGLLFDFLVWLGQWADDAGYRVKESNRTVGMLLNRGGTWRAACALGKENRELKRQLAAYRSDGQ